MAPDTMNIGSRSRHLLLSNSGMALINVIFLLILVGSLVATGAMLVESMVRRSKITTTKTTINSAVDAIISWSVANGRIPDATLPATSLTYFSNIIPNPNDAWRKGVVYIYDNNLTDVTTGGLCGRTSTAITQTGNPVAFAIISGGDDLLVNSAPSVTGAYAGTLAGLSALDLFRVVSLDEIKSRAGCSGTTSGRLRIVNNELPKICAGSTTYPTTLFADGGVPGYTWSLIAPPAWLQINAATGVISPVTAITSSAGTYPVTIQLTDSQTPTTNIIRKTLNLIVKTCTFIPPGAQITFANNMGQFQVVENIGPGVTVNPNNSVNLGGSTNDTTGCLWFPTTQTLFGKTMRGYFEFNYTPADVSVDSMAYGDGFTFTLMQSANGSNVCGTTGAGSNLGYKGLAGDSVASEFDTYPSGATYADPAPNHLAIVKRGNNTHNSNTGMGTMGRNPNCAAVSAGCFYQTTGATPNTWFEDAVTHKVRIEVSTQCPANCTPASVCNQVGQTNALIEVWTDCTEPACSSLNANNAAAPTAYHCFSLPATMNNVIFGFTEATGGAVQNLTISNFGIGFY